MLLCLSSCIFKIATKKVKNFQPTNITDSFCTNVLTIRRINGKLRILRDIINLVWHLSELKLILLYVKPAKEMDQGGFLLEINNTCHLIKKNGKKCLHLLALHLKFKHSKSPLRHNEVIPLRFH